MERTNSSKKVLYEDIFEDYESPKKGSWGDTKEKRAHSGSGSNNSNDSNGSPHQRSPSSSEESDNQKSFQQALRSCSSNAGEDIQKERSSSIPALNEFITFPIKRQPSYNVGNSERILNVHKKYEGFISKGEDSVFEGRDERSSSQSPSLHKIPVIGEISSHDDKNDLPYKIPDKEVVTESKSPECDRFEYSDLPKDQKLSPETKKSRGRSRSKSHDRKYRRSRSRSRSHSKGRKSSRSPHRERRRSYSRDRRPYRDNRRRRSRSRTRRSRSRDIHRRSRSRSYDRHRRNRYRSSSRDRYRRRHYSRSRSRSRDRSRGSSSRKPGSLPLSTSGGAITPQMALQQTMAAMNAKAQALTGIALPKYYNPAAVNPLKYAEQVQKRKLLWQSKEKVEEQPKNSVWDNLTFSQDQDGKMTAKFRKLMGIKSEGASSKETEHEEEKESVLKKQEELFRELDQQYETARMTTHTQRGVGLGYSAQTIYPVQK